MARLADLMESAFGRELEPEGQRLIREMRAYGRAGILGWLAGRFVLPPAAYPMGYVWYDERRLVGNASVLPVASGSGRWVLANVAVEAEYRRRGIARGMVQACLELAQRRGADEMLLQVESDNEGAIELYRQFGFRELTERTTYRRPAGKPVPDDLRPGLARPRRMEEWHEQFQLALAQHPEGLVWPMPVRAELFRGGGPGLLMGWPGVRHWVWSEDNQVLASLTARPDWDRQMWRLAMVAAEQNRGAVERGLISAALDELGEESGVVLDYPRGVAHDDLVELGFRPERTLTWMGKTFIEHEPTSELGWRSPRHDRKGLP
jgi:ribosomal protein S18 acetylase RimI-like enzyme